MAGDEGVIMRVQLGAQSLAGFGLAAPLPGEQLVDDVAHGDERCELLLLGFRGLVRLADAQNLAVELAVLEVERAFLDRAGLGVDLGLGFTLRCLPRTTKTLAGMTRAAATMRSSRLSTVPINTGSGVARMVPCSRISPSIICGLAA